MIGIIDYGLGNLTSVKNALDKLNVPNFISDDPLKLQTSTGLILPGVGAAGTGMKNLQAKKLDQVIKDEIQKGKPFLGTCLGMQLLFDFSDEGDTKCLGIIPGEVKLFQGNLKIPEIGWNSVSIVKNESKVMQGIKDDSYFYFVNSYYCVPADKKVVAGETEYGAIFASAIEKGNIFATQFHSEKSGKTGLMLLKNFTEVCK
ncbi:MAG TPA: imidazole glycerol phosphate synthase subunit HisH [Patescibacteria group bacterium]|nr:imidazole glycerol phosphate synthase subunit HisH [Patescibacteria group bacterium]